MHLPSLALFYKTDSCFGTNEAMCLVIAKKEEHVCSKKIGKLLKLYIHCELLPNGSWEKPVLNLNKFMYLFNGQAQTTLLA